MRGKFEDLTGQRFNNLTVDSLFGFNNSNTSLWNCYCDCGNLTIVCISDLKNDTTKSCGDTKNCKYAFDIFSIAMMIHGLSATIEYQCWLHIKQRCYNILHEGYDAWGGRGIIMFEAWINDFQAFYEYLLTLPETREQFQAKHLGKKISLDRINNNGNYVPGNIRWATIQEQSQNQRSNVITPQLAKFILWENKINNKRAREIFEVIEIKYNYSGGIDTIQNVISRRTWTNINIDKEVAEYKQFGTVNGIVIPKII